MTSENRRRLTALVAARTKLAAAADLARAATVDLAASGLFSAETREGMRAVIARFDTYGEHIQLTIERIP